MSEGGNVLETAGVFQCAVSSRLTAPSLPDGRAPRSARFPPRRRRRYRCSHCRLPRVGLNPASECRIARLWRGRCCCCVCCSNSCCASFTVIENASPQKTGQKRTDKKHWEFLIPTLILLTLKLTVNKNFMVSDGSTATIVRCFRSAALRVV